MPQNRKVEGFGRRYLLGNLIYAVPAGLCLWLLWHSFSGRSFGTTFFFALTGFSASIIFGIYRDIVRLRRFHCPKCGCRLPWKRPEPGERLRYFCAECDTVWDTGLNEADN